MARDHSVLLMYGVLALCVISMNCSYGLGLWFRGLELGFRFRVMGLGG